MLKNSSHAVLRSQSYGFDDASRVVSHTVDGVATTYGYDAIGQLLSETRSGYTASYTFDANGNRATRTVNGVVETYAVDNGDKLTSVTWSGGSKSFGYDAAGRTTSITTSAGTTTLAYDHESRVTGITYPGSSTNSFGYNAFDARVSKTDSAGTATYRRAGAGVLSAVLSDGVNDFTPGVSSRSGSTSTFSHSGLKNADSQTSSSQALTGSKTYDAFGNLVASTGTWAGPFGYGGGFGYQSDSDSSLKLLGHRYYDSSTGRFLTRDPIKDGRNWYGYCGNDPISGSDPTGLSHHDPLVIYVDPAFDGTVIVIGEPGPGLDQTWNIVPSGHHSNPKMDVDYVIVIQPDGTTTTTFVTGWGIPGDWDNSNQYGGVDSGGNVWGPGFHFVPVQTDLFLFPTLENVVEYFAWPQMNSAFARPTPAWCDTIPGSPFPPPGPVPPPEPQTSGVKIRRSISGLQYE